MATPVKHSAKNGAAIHEYGAGDTYILNVTIVGAGAAAPTVAAANDATNPPGSCEIISPMTRSGTGVYGVTLSDAYYAVKSWSVAIDDINGASPVEGYLGQFTGLQTSSPLTFTLSTYTPSGVAADIALNTACRITIWFKKNTTGAAA